MRLKERFPKNRRLMLVLAVTAILFACIGINRPLFLRAENLGNVIRQNYWLLIITAGQTLIMFGGGIDLSVGYQISLVSAITSVMVLRGVPVPVILPVILAVGAACGLLNGLFVTAFRIPPVAATVATQFIFEGISYLITGGSESSSLPGLLTAITRTKFLFFTAGEWMTAAVVILVCLLFSYTYMGRHILAVGENEFVADCTGIKTGSVKCFCYVIAGVLYALAAVVAISRQGVASSLTGVGTEWTGIIAIYLGMAFFDSRQKSMAAQMFMMVYGVYFLAFFENGMQFMGWNQNLQTVVRGALLAGAVSAVGLRNRRDIRWRLRD